MTGGVVDYRGAVRKTMFIVLTHLYALAFVILAGTVAQTLLIARALQPTTLLEVAEAVAQPFGLRVEDAVEAGSLRNPRLTAQPAEAGYELLERAARLHCVLVSTTPEGAVRLGRPTLDVAGVTLRTGSGANVESFSWRHDHSQRYRELRLIGTGDLSVLVRGTAARPGAGATDPDIRATRTAIQVAPGDLFFDELEAYARWQVAVARARSASLTAEVPSLRTRAGGPVWRPGMLVEVEIPEIEASGELLVASVALSYDLASERASLGLAVPDAYTVDPTLAERLRRGSPEVLVQA